MNAKQTTILLALTLYCLPVFAQQSSNNASKEKPKLILQITIDQMRGDFPMRYKDRLGEDGLRYLMEEGIHYNNAHFQHADTETPIGHAALFTGTFPANNGIVAGHWFDTDKGKLIYSCEDDRFPIIGKESTAGSGRAPTNLLSSTIGDELLISNNQRSRMFSVSIKDRGAILPAGHTGKAFWYSTSNGTFISSKYFYNEYPEWVEKWNKEKLADRYKNSSWELLHNASTYLFGENDDRPFEVDMFGLGTTFPHKLDGDSKYFYASLIGTPFGDELTADFAKMLLIEEKLGKGDYTDYLAISFSVTDYIGHLFGPSSLEAEDNILRLDRLLAGLFSFIDEQLGLENTLIVLSADHGMCEAPEYMQSLGYDVGRLTAETIAKDTLKHIIEAQYGIPGSVIRLYEFPYIYLNEDAIAKTKFSVAEIEAIVAKEVLKIPGIAGALTRTDITKGTFAPTALNKSILNNFHLKRSGHIHVIAEQFWYFYYEMENTTDIAAMHGAPWSYDTYVPLFFAGHGIKAQSITRPVTPYDIAATLASYLEVKPPSGCTGIPLKEVLRSQQ